MKYLTSTIITLSVFISGLALALPAFASASMYYVSTSGNDSNAGTQSAPWKTISKAASTAVGGDTINIAAGTYTENVTFSKAGTASSPIIFKGTSTNTCSNGNQQGICPSAIFRGIVKLTGSYTTLDTVSSFP